MHTLLRWRLSATDGFSLTLSFGGACVCVRYLVLLRHFPCYRTRLPPLSFFAVSTMDAAFVASLKQFMIDQRADTAALKKFTVEQKADSEVIKTSLAGLSATVNQAVEDIVALRNDVSALAEVQTSHASAINEIKRDVSALQESDKLKGTAIRGVLAVNVELQSRVDKLEDAVFRQRVIAEFHESAGQRLNSVERLLAKQPLLNNRLDEVADQFVVGPIDKVKYPIDEASVRTYVGSLIKAPATAVIEQRNADAQVFAVKVYATDKSTSSSLISELLRKRTEAKASKMWIQREYGPDLRLRFRDASKFAMRFREATKETVYFRFIGTALVVDDIPVCPVNAIPKSDKHWPTLFPLVRRLLQTRIPPSDFSQASILNHYDRAMLMQFLKAGDIPSDEMES